MSVQAAYNHWASTYDEDRNRTRDLDERVTRDILSGQRYGSIIELGCGTGKNTALLATLSLQVQALDFSPGMLARAREKVSAPHVRFSAADLTHAWPCTSASADLVVGNLVLEHIEDLHHVMREAARCLRPAGQLFLSELHPFRQYQGTVANFTRGAHTTQVPAFVHHVSDYTEAARAAGLQVLRLNEWWHIEDEGKPPRLLSLLLEKSV